MVELVDTLDLKSNLLWGPSSSLGTGRFIIFKFNIIGYKKGSGLSLP